MRTKRVYEAAADSDGMRILVDRLWPRGLSKDKARVDLWLKEIAPSNELRKWFAHDVSKMPEFRERYLAELQGKENLLVEIESYSRKHQVLTLLYGAADREHNNAVVLQGLLKKRR